jgi:hypothetical protein
MVDAFGKGEITTDGGADGFAYGTSSVGVVTATTTGSHAGAPRMPARLMTHLSCKPGPFKPADCTNNLDAYYERHTLMGPTWTIINWEVFKTAWDSATSKVMPVDLPKVLFCHR